MSGPNRDEVPSICAVAQSDPTAPDALRASASSPIGPCPHARARRIPASVANLSLWITRQPAAAEAVAVELEELDVVEDEPVDEELEDPEDSDVEDLDSLFVPESLLAAASTLPERLSVR